MIGGNDPATTIKDLQKANPGSNVKIEANRPDFLSLLDNCRCSVSMCGYNTAVELLLTATPGVLIPFDEDGETEQGIRAGSMARLDNYTVIESSVLSPKALTQAILEISADHTNHSDQSNDFSESHSIGIKSTIDGARQSVQIAQRLLLST